MNGDGFADLIVGAPGASDFSGASYVIFGSMPGEAVTRIGTAIANTIHGGNFNDTLNGLGGGDHLIGHDGNDTLYGGNGKDKLTGGAGGDTLDGGSKADTFVYTAASDSNSTSHDTAVKFNFTQDKFDIPGAVSTIDSAIGVGTLRAAHFNSDLSAAVAGLGAHHAVLFTPDTGNLAGKTFLIVDVNGTTGYQAGGDLVIQLSHAVNLASLGTEDFI